MAHKIAIASGKGGTGKTTISLNLHHFFNHLFHKHTMLIDCDVEEPNDRLFYPNAKETHQEEIFQKVASINTDSCTFCRACVEYCEYNAITVIPPVNYAKIDPSLCHSCGACFVACQHEAIIEIPHKIGDYSEYITPQNLLLAEGQLKIGSPMQTTLIKEIKARVKNKTDIIIYDAPPGTSCPVVETISDADFVILVTEPTPFGLHDLKLTVDLVKEIQKPFGIIINKADLGFQKTHEYIKEEKLELLGEIPFSKNYAAHYAQGNILKNIPEQTEEIYKTIIDQLLKKIS
jgi:MinD superfamily P-loop ATPase